MADTATPIPHEPPAAAHVYSWVRNAIANGRLIAGERYSIYWLAEETGYSRTPVREAILRLAQLGIVDIERNRGFIVRRLTIEEVRANYEARLLLEVPGARAAARRADPSLTGELYVLLKRMDELLEQGDSAAQLEWDRTLHAQILGAGENSRVSAFASTLRDASVQTWELYRHNTAQDRHRNHQQHYDIVDAIAAGDAEAAGRAMQRHLETTALTLMRHVAKQEGLEVPAEFTGRLRPYPDQD